MKTPEEYIREFIQPQVLSITSIARMAYQIQKDSYNQAIQDVINERSVIIYGIGAPTNSILKLKIK